MKSEGVYAFKKMAPPPIFIYSLCSKGWTQWKGKLKSTIFNMWGVTQVETRPLLDMESIKSSSIDSCGSNKKQTMRKKIRKDFRPNLQVNSGTGFGCWASLPPSPPLTHVEKLRIKKEL